MSALTTIVYLAGTALYLLYLALARPGLARAGRAALALGFVLHTALLGLRMLEIGYPPVASLGDSLSLLTWLLVGGYLVVSLKRGTMVLGSFVSPIAAALMVSAWILPRATSPLTPGLHSVWIPIHVWLVLSGEAIFALAFCAGIMYLFQERQLKTKQLGLLARRLPSLELLDRLNWRLLTIGFPLLTFGFIAGMVVAASAWGAFWSWDPKQVWALITWLLYAVQLHSRLTAGWRGRRAAILSIVGFVVLLFTFLGVNLVQTSLHRFV
ncbi:MAG: c-type cytochrome biogenesis protein CcsB [Deltaproteobacteria bacterium]|nr:c-type cytochrome biogenesis protein CcsB [Deltaproteobacteria bacterium]